MSTQHGSLTVCSTCSSQWMMEMSWASYARERTDSLRFAPISQSVRSSVAYCRCSRGCWETENWILAHAYLQSISRSTALSLGSGLGTSHSGDRSHKTSIAKSSRRKDIANMSRLHIRAYNHQYSGWVLGSLPVYDLRRARPTYGWTASLSAPHISLRMSTPSFQARK